MADPLLPKTATARDWMLTIVDLVAAFTIVAAFAMLAIATAPDINPDDSGGLAFTCDGSRTC